MLQCSVLDYIRLIFVFSQSNAPMTQFLFKRSVDSNKVEVLVSVSSKNKQSRSEVVRCMPSPNTWHTWALITFLYFATICETMMPVSSITTIANNGLVQCIFTIHKIVKVLTNQKYNLEMIGGTNDCTLPQCKNV